MEKRSSLLVLPHTHSFRIQSAQSGAWGFRKGPPLLPILYPSPSCFEAETTLLQLSHHCLSPGHLGPASSTSLLLVSTSNATLGSESVSIRKTWPSHLHLLFLITTESGSRLQGVSRSSVADPVWAKDTLDASKTFSLEDIKFPGNFPDHLPAFTSVQ